MTTALIGLGSNLGDRAAALEKAIELLREEPQIRVEAVSRFRPSKPAGGPEGQGEFLNAAARLDTSLSPEELLARLLAIEDQVGRVREKRWGPRVIDLDLLLCDRVELKTPTLELPHPRMCYRRFVLEPAAEIAGEMVWPVNGWNVEKLLKHLNTTPNYIALAGGHFGLRTTLALAMRDIPRLAVLVSPTRTRMSTYSSDDRGLAFNAHEVDWGTPRIFLAGRAAALCEAALRRDEWLLTDFWFEQIPAVIHWMRSVVRLQPNMDERVVTVWRELRTVLPIPKLIIFCNWATMIPHGDESFRSILDEYAPADSIGPQLRLGFAMDDTKQAAQEVLAAMQAME